MLAVWSADKWHGIPIPWIIVAGLLALMGVFGGLNALHNRKYYFLDGLVSGVVGRMGSGKSLFIVTRVLRPFCRALSANGGVIPSSTGRPVRRVITNFRFDAGMPNVEVRNVAPTAEDSIFAQLIKLAETIGVDEAEGPWLDEQNILHDGREPIPTIAVCYRCGGTAEGGPVAQAQDDWQPCTAHMVETIELPKFGREPILNALVVLDEMHLFAGSSKVAIGDEAGFVISMARKYNSEIWWASQHEMKVHKRLRDESSTLWLAGKLTGFASFFVGSGWHVARSFDGPAQVEAARKCVGTTKTVRASDRRIYRYTAKVGKWYNSFELIVPDPSRRSGTTERMLARRSREDA